MASQTETTHAKLTELWQNPRVKTLPLAEARYVLLSDIHLGDGGPADDFRHNQEILVEALRWYHRQNYRLILLGDIEELWQFDLEPIVAQYERSVYRALRQFGKQVYRVYGNHDREWGGFADPLQKRTRRSNLAPQALKLSGADGKASMLLVHGHQGSLDSDKFAWISRFLLRAFRPLEPLSRLVGLYPEKSSTKTEIPSDYERMMYQWARDQRAILICGHSHRAIFAARTHAEKLMAELAEQRAELAMQADLSVAKRTQGYLRVAEIEHELADEKEKGRLTKPTTSDGNPLPCYFNTGCCLYTDGLTAIEIDGQQADEIRLVKWDPAALRTKTPRDYGRAQLSEILAQVAAG